MPYQRQGTMVSVLRWMTSELWVREEKAVVITVEREGARW